MPFWIAEEFTAQGFPWPSSIISFFPYLKNAKRRLINVTCKRNELQCNLRQCIGNAHDGLCCRDNPFRSLYMAEGERTDTVTLAAAEQYDLESGPLARSKPCPSGELTCSAWMLSGIRLPVYIAS